jgi:hypothetical protein
LSSVIVLSSCSQLDCSVAPHQTCCDSFFDHCYGHHHAFARFSPSCGCVPGCDCGVCRGLFGIRQRREERWKRGAVRREKRGESREERGERRRERKGEEMACVIHRFYAVPGRARPIPVSTAAPAPRTPSALTFFAAGPPSLSVSLRLAIARCTPGTANHTHMRASAEWALAHFGLGHNEAFSVHARALLSAGRNRKIPKIGSA